MAEDAPAPQTKPPAFWKTFVAGGFAGVGNILTGHPMDTVKVRLQTQVAKPGEPLPYNGLVDCVRKTVSNEGFRGLYKGMATPLVGYTPMWALCFMGYDAGKKIQGKPTAEMNLAEIAFAGGVAGVATTIVMAPAERVKVLLQAPGSTYKGPIDCLRQLGLRGTFQGTLATLARDVPASAAYFGTNEAVKRFLARPDGTNSTGALLFAGGMAGVMNWTVCMPMDVVKSRVQTAKGSEGGGFATIMRKLVVEEGIRGMYKGYGAVLVRAFPCNAIGFLLYDVAINQLTRVFPE